MPLVREDRLYRAYCNFCYYTGKKPLPKSKWQKIQQSPANQNRTADSIQKELDESREHS